VARSVAARLERGAAVFATRTEFVCARPGIGIRDRRRGRAQVQGDLRNPCRSFQYRRTTTRSVGYRREWFSGPGIRTGRCVEHRYSRARWGSAQTSRRTPDGWGARRRWHPASGGGCSCGDPAAAADTEFLSHGERAVRSPGFQPGPPATPVQGHGNAVVAVAFVNGRVLTDAGVQEGLTVVTGGAHIASVTQGRHSPRCAEQVDLGGNLLLPGFIDTQVNGGAGTLFNDHPTVEGIEKIGRAHRQFGTTGFLPTLVSDDLDVVAAAISAVQEAIAAGIPGVLGIHIEGPFLHEARRGIHDASKIRDRDE